MQLANFLKRLGADRRGVTTVEYGLLASLVALASIQALGGLGRILDASFGSVAEEVADPADISPAGGATPDSPPPGDAPLGDPASTSGGEPDAGTPSGGTGTSGGADTSGGTSTSGDTSTSGGGPGNGGGNGGNGGGGSSTSGDLSSSTSGGAYEPPIAAAVAPGEI